MRHRRTVAILGCGALGTTVADGVVNDLAESWELAGVTARSEACARTLAEEMGCSFWPDVAAMLAAKPDVVVEAAGIEAAREHAEAILASGASLIMLSCGVLADDGFEARLRAAAEKGGSVLHIPNGAMGGYDVLRTLAFRREQCRRRGEDDGIYARVFSFRSPLSLAGAPALEKRGENIMLCDRRETVFMGSAREAIAGFPRNVNVAVGAAAASAGIDDTMVTITADPDITENVHRIEASAFGVRVSMEFVCSPDPENPRANIMSAWSVLALLKELASPLRYF